MIVTDEQQLAEAKRIVEELMEMRRSMKRMNRKLEEIANELASRRH